MRLPVRAVLNIFATPIICFDITSEKVKGRDVTNQDADRKIKGVIQPADNKAIALLPDGAESDGAQVLHTAAAVSAYDVTNNGEVKRQTYVRHAGEVWKLWRVQNWAIHTGNINRYILTKYRDVNNTI